MALLTNGDDRNGVTQRGTYQRYTGKERDRIGNYKVVHGISAAIDHFRAEFPGLKPTTMCE